MKILKEKKEKSYWSDDGIEIYHYQQRWIIIKGFQRLSDEMARFSWRHQLKYFQQEFRVVAFDNRCVDRLDGRCGDEKELVLSVQKYQG